jgi:hypothetical protein
MERSGLAEGPLLFLFPFRRFAFAQWGERAVDVLHFSLPCAKKDHGHHFTA